MTLAATGMGVILGTAGYMSPEQARGRPVDRRTDIWSFGAVLFECLTGVQCFGGETVSDTIARILQGEPDWTLLPASTPASVRHLLRRCLEKDARQRLRDIGDARLELEGAIAAIRSGVRPAPEAPEIRATRRAWIGGALLLGAAVGAGALALVLALRGAPGPAGLDPRPRRPGGPVRLSARCVRWAPSSRASRPLRPLRRPSVRNPRPRRSQADRLAESRRRHLLGRDGSGAGLRGSATGRGPDVHGYHLVLLGRLAPGARRPEPAEREAHPGARRRTAAGAAAERPPAVLARADHPRRAVRPRQPEDPGRGGAG